MQDVPRCANLLCRLKSPKAGKARCDQDVYIFSSGEQGKRVKCDFEQIVCDDGAEGKVKQGYKKHDVKRSAAKQGPWKG